MILTERDIQLNIFGAVNAFKFDDQDRTSESFHGLSHCMKAVDFVIEFKDRYIFMEIKKPQINEEYSTDKEFTKLINDLTIKYRDSFLYQWAAEKVEKPVFYFCLIELENNQLLKIKRELRRILPVVSLPKQWKKPIVKDCIVANIETWNKNFPEMKITKVAGAAV